MVAPNAPPRAIAHCGVLGASCVGGSAADETAVSSVIGVGVHGGINISQREEGKDDEEERCGSDVVHGRSWTDPVEVVLG